MKQERKGWWIGGVGGRGAMYIKKQAIQATMLINRCSLCCTYNYNTTLVSFDKFVVEISVLVSVYSGLTPLSLLKLQQR